MPRNAFAAAGMRPEMEAKERACARAMDVPCFTLCLQHVFAARTRFVFAGSRLDFPKCSSIAASHGVPCAPSPWPGILGTANPYSL